MFTLFLTKIKDKSILHFVYEYHHNASSPASLVGATKNIISLCINAQDIVESTLLAMKKYPWVHFALSSWRPYGE
jgi:hypothetical protein